MLSRTTIKNNNANSDITTKINTYTNNTIKSMDFKLTYLKPISKEKITITTDTVVAVEDVEDLPFILLNEHILKNINKGQEYLMIMYDINANGGIYIHIIIHYNKSKLRGISKIKYIPPSPPEDTGAHKYICELVEFKQKDDLELYYSSLSLKRIIDNFTTLLDKLNAKELNIKKSMIINIL